MDMARVVTNMAPAQIPTHRWACGLRSAGALTLLSCVPLLAAAWDQTYLQGLLSATPQGGWVKVSTGTFGSSWPTGADLTPPTPSTPRAVVRAWSGFGWDSARGDLLLFGGGHANYAGNEVYTWHGTNGQWERGTLPSRVDLTNGWVVGNGAPQSSHTYETNIYVPINDRVVVFGGANWPFGYALEYQGARTGVWWWDPALADPNRVGGATGTGWDSARLGANSWQVRTNDPWVGTSPVTGPGYIYGSTGYRQEGGKDVVYVTMDTNASGFPSLYRYQLGTSSTPDVWQRVGVTGNSVLYSGAATIDTNRGLFVRTASVGVSYQTDLALWNLANNNSANPNANASFGVSLVDSQGVQWQPNDSTSIDYDVANDQYVIWDGTDGGSVWVTRPSYLTNGSLSPTWTVELVNSTTVAQPTGNFDDGVLGKWKYVAELGAFVALDSFQDANNDAAVWLYRPMASTVPEPGAAGLMAVGLGLGLLWHSRRRHTGGRAAFNGPGLPAARD